MRRWALVAALLLALTGCATIPLSGGPQSGGLIGAAGQTDVEYLPAGPTHNSSPTEILEGFLAAGAAPQNNYRIARQFLTPKAAEAWKPASETYVRTGQLAVTTPTPTRIQASSALVGVVDADGVFTPSLDGERMSLSFAFEKVNNQWRISSAPNLTALSQVAFNSTFNEHSVYFFSLNHAALIPEVRMFARQADPVTAVARAVIAGPSSRLPNAESAFPADVKLATVPVDVISGHATVALSEGMTALNATLQREIVTEMNASLTSLSQIDSVSYTVNGVPLPVAPNENYVIEARVDSRPLVLRSEMAGFATKSGFESIPTIGEAIDVLSPRSLSFNESYQVAAVYNARGIYRVNDRIHRVSKGRSIVEPQIGGAESVWWVAPRTANRIEVSSASGKLSFSGPWPRQTHITGLEVSREESRVAIAVDEGGTSRLYLAAIELDSSGRPRAIDGFFRLPISVTKVIDLAWSDSTHIAVLGTVGDTTRVELASVGGFTTKLGEPRLALQISGGNDGVAGLVVRTADGELWSPRGQGWQKLGIVADSLATQN